MAYWGPLFHLILIAACWTLTNTALWNAAVFKPTSQSSDFVNFVENDPPDNSHLAVDGIKNPDVALYRSCSHTRYDKPAWWIVDLQGLYSIKQVGLTNRKSWSRSRLRNFMIQAFLNDPRDASVAVEPQICIIHGDSSLPEGDTVFVCEREIIGRYVRVIWLDGYKNYLTLCEVEVFVDSVHTVYHNYDVKESVRFTETPLQTLHTPTALTCSLECNNRRDKELCTAFNWNSELRECRLLSVRPQNSIGQIYDVDWALYRMTPHG